MVSLEGASLLATTDLLGMHVVATPRTVRFGVDPGVVGGAGITRGDAASLMARDAFVERTRSALADGLLAFAASRSFPPAAERPGGRRPCE